MVRSLKFISRVHHRQLSPHLKVAPLFLLTCSLAHLLTRSLAHSSIPRKANELLHTVQVPTHVHYLHNLHARISSIAYYYCCYYYPYYHYFHYVYYIQIKNLTHLHLLLRRKRSSSSNPFRQRSLYLTLPTTTSTTITFFQITYIYVLTHTHTHTHTYTHIYTYTHTYTHVIIFLHYILSCPRKTTLLSSLKRYIFLHFSLLFFPSSLQKEIPSSIYPFINFHNSRRESFGLSPFAFILSTTMGYA